MPRIAMKTVSYLPDTPFRFKRMDDYFMVTKANVMPGDDFCMTMTLMEFDGVYTCWIGMDMARCDKGFYEVMWDAIHAETDLISKDHFFVSATHTHSGPVFTKFNEMGPESFFKESMGDLARHCGQTAVQLFRDIHNDMHEFISEIKTVWINGCFSNRNNLDGPCDRNAVLLRFKDKESQRPIGMWFAMNCHSTVTFPKNKYVCSDLVGHVWKKVAAHYHVPVMPMCGAQGDTSTRLTRHLDGTPDSEIKALYRIVNGVTSQILAHDDGFEPLTIDRFRISYFSVSFQYTIDPEYVAKQLKNAEKEAEEASQSNDQELIRAKKTKVRAIRNKMNGETEINRSIPCALLNLGELKFAAISGELNASLGLKIVRHQPHDHRMVVCYINDRACGYLVEREEYGKSFESASSIVPIGVPEVLTDMAIHEMEKADVENGAING